MRRKERAKTMKLITDDNILFLEGESKEHIMLQLILFFECNEWEIDFKNKTFRIFNKSGVVLDE